MIVATISGIQVTTLEELCGRWCRSSDGCFDAFEAGLLVTNLVCDSSVRVWKGICCRAAENRQGSYVNSRFRPLEFGVVIGHVL